MFVHVIEDDRAVRHALAVFLEEEGFCVFTYENATSFLSEGESGPHDLILLDLGLPDLPGAELNALLRKKGVKSQIVAISGLRLGAFETAVRQISPLAAFRKPLDLPALLDSITVALRT